MRNFRKILYVNHGTTDEISGLKQALSLTRNNESSLTVLIVGPEFPADIPDYRRKYETALIEQAQKSIGTAMTALKLTAGEIEISVDLMLGGKPSIRVIQHVLRGGYDLLVKEAETRGQDGVFKAFDMALLRKCPCPVWLCRPIDQSRKDIRVGVAIDPEAPEEAARLLSLRMLQLSRSLADSCSGTLYVVSCWHYEHEGFLRHNPWAKADEETIREILAKEEKRHREALDRLAVESKIVGAREIHHVRGAPAAMIPAFVTENHVDILVMGTVARTGVPGLMIGNTAENIIQELPCSLMALKPQGFVSPVQAYD